MLRKRQSSERPEAILVDGVEIHTFPYCNRQLETFEVRRKTYCISHLNLVVHKRSLRSFESKITNGRSSISDAEPLDGFVVRRRDTRVLRVTKIDSEVEDCSCVVGMMSEDEHSCQDGSEGNHYDCKGGDPANARVSKSARRVPFCTFLGVE